MALKNLEWMDMIWMMNEWIWIVVLWFILSGYFRPPGLACPQLYLVAQVLIMFDPIKGGSLELYWQNRVAFVATFKKHKFVVAYRCSVILSTLINKLNINISSEKLMLWPLMSWIKHPISDPLSSTINLLMYRLKSFVEVIPPLGISSCIHPNLSPLILKYYHIYT